MEIEPEGLQAVRQSADEGTVWEPFLTDDQGQVRRDERGRPLPGQHYCPVMFNLC